MRCDVSPRPDERPIADSAFQIYGQRQKLETDLNTRGLGGRRVDGKPDPGILNNEDDDSNQPRANTSNPGKTHGHQNDHRADTTNDRGISPRPVGKAVSAWRASNRLRPRRQTDRVLKIYVAKADGFARVRELATSAATGGRSLRRSAMVSRTPVPSLA